MQGNKLLGSLDDYELVPKMSLGQGAFASVKLVRHKTTKEQFALKEIDLQKSTNVRVDVENLKREINNHKKMRHKNIILFHDYLQIGKKIYMLLEYAPNGNLFKYLSKKGKLDEKSAVAFFGQVASALQYIHDSDVIHRDLKPENLLLSKDNTIKMCDFGWCVEFNNQMRETFCGTYEYIAPEIFQKRPYDRKVDIWALGILLYEMLHGYSPFKSRSPSEIFRNIVRNQISFGSWISSEAKDLISRILNLRPSSRPSIPEIMDHQLIQKYLPKPDLTPKQILKPLNLQAAQFYSYENGQAKTAPSTQRMGPGCQKPPLYESNQRTPCNEGTFIERAKPNSRYAPLYAERKPQKFEEFFSNYVTSANCPTQNETPEERSVNGSVNQFLLRSKSNQENYFKPRSSDEPFKSDKICLNRHHKIPSPNVFNTRRNFEQGSPRRPLNTSHEGGKCMNMRSETNQEEVHKQHRKKSNDCQRSKSSIFGKIGCFFTEIAESL